MVHKRGQKSELAGTLMWVDVFSETLNLIGKDGKHNVLPFDPGGADLVNYWKYIGFTSQQVKCALEDGVVKEVATAQAPAR